MFFGQAVVGAGRVEGWGVIEGRCRDCEMLEKQHRGQKISQREKIIFVRKPGISLSRVQLPTNHVNHIIPERTRLESGSCFSPVGLLANASSVRIRKRCFSTSMASTYSLREGLSLL